MRSRSFALNPTVTWPLSSAHCAKTGLERLISPDSSRQRDLIVAMIAARIVDPSSKLATARALDSEDSSSNSLGELLGLQTGPG